MGLGNPAGILKYVSKNWPMAWDITKKLRSNKGKKLSDWPDWCYVPFAAGKIISAQKKNLTLLEKTICPWVITAAATWRTTQGIYRFDPDLYDELVGQSLKGRLPSEILTCLPEWCVYIETPGAKFCGTPVYGFWALLNHAHDTESIGLFLVFNQENGEYFPVFAGAGSETLETYFEKIEVFDANPSDNDTIMKTFKRIASPEEIGEIRTNFLQNLVPFIQLVLYLCAENTDIPVQPRHPNTRVRMSGQVDVPKEPRVWMVGERIGASIRKYRNEERQNEYRETSSTHASPRPHVRRAHWHHFWAGPKTGEQKLILRWLPPIPVNVDEDYTGPTVIHRVSGS